MKAFGQHLLAEYRNCDPAVINDTASVENLLREAVNKAGATIVASVFHPFEPQGITGVVVVEESHLSIHTWPEHGYVAVDFYTCGDCDPARAYAFLKEELSAGYAELMRIDRGLEAPGTSMAVRHHLHEHPGEPELQRPERAAKLLEPAHPEDKLQRTRTQRN